MLTSPVCHRGQQHCGLLARRRLRNTLVDTWMQYVVWYMS